MRILSLWLLIGLINMSALGENMRFYAEGYGWEVISAEGDSSHNVRLYGLENGVESLINEDKVLEIPSVIEYDGIKYTVTEIGECIFADGLCPFKKVILPESLIFIDYFNFYDDEIEEVIFNDKLETIGYGCFMGLENLTSIEFPNSLQRIEEMSFRGLGVRHLKLPPGENLFLWDYAFSDMQNLETIDFNGLKYFKFGVFRDLPKVEKIDFPEEVCDIMLYSFGNLPSLKTIVLPRTVEWDFSYEIFNKCPNVERIYARSATPISMEKPLGDWGTETLNYENITLYVPIGSLDAYMQDPVWNVYGKIVEYDVTGISNPEVDSVECNVDTPVEIYTVAGEYIGDSTEALRPGVYIIRHGDEAHKILINR